MFNLQQFFVKQMSRPDYCSKFLMHQRHRGLSLDHPSWFTWIANELGGVVFIPIIPPCALSSNCFHEKNHSNNPYICSFLAPHAGVCYMPSVENNITC